MAFGISMDNAVGERLVMEKTDASVDQSDSVLLAGGEDVSGSERAAWLG